MKKSIFVVAILLSTVLSAKTVKPGIEVLREQKFKLLEGKRIGLITNPTGVDSKLKATIDILNEAPNVKLVALFGPEHGVRGDAHAGDEVDNVSDPKTGLPVYSLYGKSRKATPEMLKGIDMLVYDIQDVGCRSYTFISTLGLAMEAAAENNIEFVVLDRPNPLGGEKIEGNLAEDSFISFVSQFKIPYLYGQTCGELALMLNGENMLKKKCKLTVVKMKGWHRNMNWEDTGLEWIIASPHIPNKSSSYFYPVTGILGELGYLSIGVGYTLPFQMVGAPWIKAEELARAMNSLKLEGLEFRPIYFKPFYATFKDENCQGIEIHIMDYRKAKLSEVQFYIMQELNKLYPEKAVFNNASKDRYQMFDKVCGSDQIRLRFSKNHLFSDIKDYWYKDVDSYRKLSEKYYLYR
ncbi:MAG: DUF1343 domain-containing protein [Paludibacter sp.]|jgi:uncharacterized protein YbbC (DUF1343 family)|nr:DUF1343 domain-containing protein [Paludibacter sp.]